VQRSRKRHLDGQLAVGLSSPERVSDKTTIAGEATTISNASGQHSEQHNARSWIDPKAAGS
jgi:hypothetical protein